MKIFFNSHNFFENKEENNEETLNALFAKAKNSADYLQSISLDDLCAFFEECGKNFAKNPDTKKIQGIAFASIWMKKENLLSLATTALGNPAILKSFVENGKKKVRAQPRGLAVHWIAGNVGTLFVFSLVQSMLAGNSNLLRLPSSNFAPALAMLKAMHETSTAQVDGKKLLQSIVAVGFPSEDLASNALLSQNADCRILWGGEEMVSSISSLPKSSFCEDIIFGPKYSFSAIDAKTQKMPSFEATLKSLASDIIAFEQSACSSPHTVFLEEGGELSLQETAKILGKKLDEATKNISFEMDDASAYKIMALRADYSFSANSSAIFSKDLKWTVLCAGPLRLEEPCQNRTVFLKKIPNIQDAAFFATKKTQTIGLAITGEKQLEQFAENASKKGVARITKIGSMNFFETPWDGLYPLQRLVRFCSYSPQIAGEK